MTASISVCLIKLDVVCLVFFNEGMEQEHSASVGSHWISQEASRPMVMNYKVSDGDDDA